MKALIEGIKIHCFNVNPADRVFLSNGMKEAKGDIDGLFFEDQSFQANAPWRPINENEEKILFTHEQIDYQNSVGVIKLPDDLIEQMKFLGFQNYAHYTHLNDIRKNHPRKYIKVMNELYEFKERFSQKDTKIVHKMKTRAVRFNRENVTVNKQQPLELVGLHIDSWDDSFLAHVESTTNRMCVNIGAQPRYFLFINLRVKDLINLTKNNNPIDINSGLQDQLAYNFFKAYRSYPVIKLKINPYEAYIAPTENIIHDGSTEGNTVFDVSITSRGYFNTAYDGNTIKNYPLKI